MKCRVIRIVVTGSECTGKTTLARELAQRYGAPCSGEFARQYLTRKGDILTADDVNPIAAGQIEGEDQALEQAAVLVVHDTDLVSTVVYARHYYGSCPAWIVQALRRRCADLYLLLHPDVPWVADGLQRDRPEQREHLHGQFHAVLMELGARFVDVSGSWENRRAIALLAIEELVSEYSISNKES